MYNEPQQSAIFCKKLVLLRGCYRWTAVGHGDDPITCCGKRGTKEETGTGELFLVAEQVGRWLSCYLFFVCLFVRFYRLK